jgi:hypothetical protein
VRDCILREPNGIKMRSCVVDKARPEKGSGLVDTVGF